MATLTKKDYAEDATAIHIPDRGLGPYVEGYSNRCLRFNPLQLLWLLLPVVGWIIFLMELCRYLWTHTHPRRVLVYRDGFIAQRLRGDGSVRREDVYRYDGLEGIKVERTRQYSVVYGVKRYNGTTIRLGVLTLDGRRHKVFNGIYRNQDEKDEKGYNDLAYAARAIVAASYPYYINRFNNDMKRNGSVTFVTSTGPVTCMPGGFEAGGVRFDKDFRYGIGNGELSLTCQEEKNGKTKTRRTYISLVDMYNKEVFLTVMSSLYGVK